MRAAVVGLSVSATTVSVACTAASERATAEIPAVADSGTSPAPTPPAERTGEQNRQIVAAEAALAGWLDGAREGSEGSAGDRDEDPAATRDTPPAADCDDVGSIFPSPLLAGWTLISSDLRGDTVVVRVAVTTVAEQDIDRRASDRFVARQRVRTDVLEWDVVPTDDGWMVCNGIRFGYRGADSLTRWIPEGSSYASARALADSVRKAKQ